MNPELDRRMIELKGHFDEIERHLRLIGQSINELKQKDSNFSTLKRQLKIERYHSYEESRFLDQLSDMRELCFVYSEALSRLSNHLEA